ncbi:hypothetical protein AZ78_4734 [Lysobacter capsici AZ78]|uniref:Uncharacterized protein n=1 Tax=Lysobacter capsici AZ78 TaxID=1444315 RepID=A0A125MNP2_9GAMM|nr:hypothetical protein AZ78_4734 [Lysobacter capsici AZ78]
MGRRGGGRRIGGQAEGWRRAHDGPRKATKTIPGVGAPACESGYSLKRPARRRYPNSRRRHRVASRRSRSANCFRFAALRLPPRTLASNAQIHRKPDVGSASVAQLADPAAAPDPALTTIWLFPEAYSDWPPKSCKRILSNPATNITQGSIWRSERTGCRPWRRSKRRRGIRISPTPPRSCT